MTVVESLSLDKQQLQYFTNRIIERSPNLSTLKMDLSNMKANIVDFSFLNTITEESMNETQGKQFIIPLKLENGMDGELAYTEINGASLSHVATKTKDNTLMEKFQRIAFSNSNFKKLLDYVVEQRIQFKNRGRIYHSAR
ncbi:hypothetical protein [Virgibacillus sp. YIM 98842]|uniref:hypothetical protein n=1 Tax=Virgibacillus sp. YIM 98842 TaxID=2663533 RepID=UPI0013D9518E|nr:hypothetical protein [Virgibacillus sp. YIM 98842]